MRTIRLATVIMVSLVFVMCAFAQPPEIEWWRHYGGQSSDICMALDVTSDGSCVLAGKTGSFGNVEGDFWLIKVNADGDSMWSSNYGGYSWDGCNSVQQTSDGGFILGGMTFSFGPPGWNAWIVRTDPNGDSLWSRVFSGPGEDNVLAIHQTSDGGYYVCGYASWYTAYTCGYLMKLDANGDSVWSRPFMGGSATAICPLGNGDCMVAGSAVSAQTGMAAFRLSKVNANGDSVWSQTYNRDSSYSTCRSICRASDGGFILAGTSASYITEDGGGDFWMVKTDANGDSLWSQILGTSISVESCDAVWPTADGGYILSGEVQTLGTGTNADLWVVRTDANGNEMWNFTFGGEGTEVAFAVQQTTDGGYLVGGWQSLDEELLDEFLLIKLAPEMSVPNAPIPERICFISNYPNPFNSTTVLQFAVPRTSRVMIRAYDVLGREIDMIADDMYSTGEYSISWQCPDCASGMYWIRLSGDGFNLARKTILLR